MRKFTLILAFAMSVLSFQVAKAESALLDIVEATFPVSAYGGNGVSNAYDGDRNTLYWSNGSLQSGHTFKFYFGGVATVDDITFYFDDNDRVSAADIEVSENGEEWNKVGGFDNGTELSSYTCNANGARARYVRMKVVTPNGGSWFKLREVEIYGNMVEADVVYTPHFTGTKNTDRPLNSVKLTGEAFGEFNYANSKLNQLYVDATSTEFKVLAGETVAPVANYGGDWMHAYVYVDYNSDGFTAGVAGDGYTPTEDLVSYSAYNAAPDNGGIWRNSAGQQNGNNTRELPTFVAPSEAGTYRMRFKMDWNSIDPAGCNTSGNTLKDNRGTIIDVTLKVYDNEEYNVEMAQAAFDAAYAAAVEVLNEAYSNEYPLQVTKDNEPYYIWTNQPETTEGPISQLVDGIIGNTSNDNFFHTNWHGDSEPIHYIEIDLGEGNGVKDFSFSYTTRAAVQNDYPDAIQVVGSNVKNGEYTQIANITSGLPQTGRTAYKSQEFHSAEAYRYIRFNVSAERKYWHMTEFDLLCCAGEYKFIKEAYQSKQAEYEALLSLYNQHANTADYTAEQYNAATEAINNAIIAATKLSEAQKAEAAAFFDVYAGKVGYPVQSVIDTYKASIAAAESESEIEAAKQVVYASTDVNLPVAGKAYTLTVVAKNGNKYYLNYTGGNIAIVARAENAELPLTALYGCEAYDGGVALKTVDGNYLVFCSKNATFGGITDGNTQGFQSELNAMAKLTFAKIANGGSVSANNNEQLFGLLSWNSLRGHKDTGEELTGYMVIKTSDATYDGAGAPFFNDNFSSALLLEEYSNQPTVGGFYNIRSANTYRNYVNTTALIYTNANNAVKWANGHGAANSNAVWTIEKDGNNYYAKNLHTGMYLNGLSMSETPATVAPSLLGDDQYIIIANGNMLHAQSSGNGIAGYDCRWDSQVNKSNASAWYIDEVESFGYTLAVSAAEWSTLILGYNAVIPENVTCYAVSSINGDWATLSEVEGVLPANTAVFVNAAQGEYTFTYTANTAEATSMLAGTLYNKNVTPATGATVYVLSKVGDVVGLYPAKVEDGTVYNNANKAYLEIASASKAIQFNFEGTTGVEDVQGADVETVIYDLTGRRVQQMNAAGIYIVNGKKVLVK